MKTLTVDKEGEMFVVDDLSEPGSPVVGRGRTLKESIGDYFINNQKQFGVEFEVKPQAQLAEHRRRAKANKER